MPRLKQFAGFFCVALILCGLPSCGQSPASGADGKGYEATTIRINASNNIGNVIAHIIQLQGLLDGRLPEDVSVEWSAIPNATDLRDALASNNLDMGVLITSTTITGIENGLPIVILENGNSPAQKIFSANPDIHSLDDIQPHHKIATTAVGGTSQLGLMLYCEETYGDHSKFNNNIIGMPIENIIAALSSGSLDAAMVTFPHAANIEKLENVETILDLAPMIKKYQIGTFFVGRQDFADKNPELVRIVLDAAQEARDFLNEHPDEAARILAEHYQGVSAADIENQIRAIPMLPEVSESAYDQLAQLMFEVEMLPAPPKPFSDLPNYDSIPKVA